MAITTGIASVAIGAKQASDQKKVARRGLRASDRVREEQDYYNQLLKNLLTNPREILNDPGYDFAFDQGIQAVERSNAARGFTGSGNAAIDLQRYGQSFASSFLKQREDLLASLSGLQASESPSAGINAATAANSSGADILSSTLASLGYSFTKGGFQNIFGGGTPGASAGTPASTGSVPGATPPFVGPR